MDFNGLNRCFFIGLIGPILSDAKTCWLVDLLTCRPVDLLTCDVVILP